LRASRGFEVWRCEIIESNAGLLYRPEMLIFTDDIAGLVAAADGRLPHVTGQTPSVSLQSHLALANQVSGALANL